jgi:hypothetical protein
MEGWEKAYSEAGKEAYNPKRMSNTRKASKPQVEMAPMDMKAGGMSAASTAAQGGSGADIASSGLMATGNPYAMAGGLALGVISSGQKRKASEKKAEAQAEMQRRQNVMQAMQNFGVGIGTR